MPHFRWRGTTLLLDCVVQPRARQTAIAGLHGERLKVRLQTPPADGAANRLLVETIADLTETPASRVELVAGSSDRRKRLAIHEPGCIPDALEIPHSERAPH